MATTINASASSGLITTADTSTILQLQTGGTAAVTVDASQRTAFVAGTAALPAITTTGDTNTGIYFPAADTIAFAEGGVESMRIDSSGNVGIGRSPNYQLDVYRSGTTNTTVASANDNVVNILQVSGNTAGVIGTITSHPLLFTAGNTERMRIDTAGNVGIGVTNPSAKLTISSGATVNNFFASTTGTNTYTPTASTSLLSANWQIQAGNASGACSGIRLSHGSSFELFLGGVQEAGGAAAFVFQGYDGSSYAERMRITSAGNVAIGTATPQGKLHVVDQVDRTSTTGQFTITGSGYQAAHWLDATAYYIGQNSNSRELRIYSGSSNTVGVRLTAGNNAWQTYSDERMKDIIEPIENAAQKVSTLRTVIGKYKTDEADTRRVFMIAQDVQAVLPEAVTTDAEGMLGMAYDHIVPLLTAAIKEQQAIITSLTDRITALEGTTP